MSHKKLFISLFLLLAVVSCFYFRPDYYFGSTVRDHGNNLEKLNNIFKSQVDLGNPGLGTRNSGSYKYKDGSSWEIIQPAPNVPWYANFIDISGKRNDKFLEFKSIWSGTDEMYFEKPYLFLTSHPGYLHVYNTETHQLRTFDARTNNCRDYRTYLIGVAYENGVLYTSQFKEWSWCTGNFKQKFKLNF